MLTSHLRSHQPIPRSAVNNKPNPLNNKVVNYTARNYQRPALLQQQRTPGNIKPNQQIIRCGHCNMYFTTTKELGHHKCEGKTPSTSNGGNKLNDLASIAMSEQPKSYSKQIAPKRKASPKKVKENDSLKQTNNEQQQGEQEETQLIMILNQVTGELMEITAPKGMEVKDVIESLNFQSMDEVSSVVDSSIVEDQIIVQEKTENIEQEETAAAIEIISQQTNEVDPESSIAEQDIVEEQHHQDAIITDDGTQMIIEHQEETKVEVDDDGQIAQIIATGEDQSEQAIILPAGCFNEDGSLTLDADTLSRLNLTISEDGQITSDPNAAFIIDPTAAAE